MIFELPASRRESRWGRSASRSPAARTGPHNLLFHNVRFDEAELLMKVAPDTFVSVPHYRDSNCIAAHIGPLEPETLRALIERRFRKIAPKRMVKDWEKKSSPLGGGGPRRGGEGSAAG